MKILYAGADDAVVSAFTASRKDGIVLLYNNWDDYGNRTTFPTLCVIGGKEVELGPVKIMFAGHPYSHPFLVERRANGWNGRFPIKDADYVSVTASTVFYEQLIGVAGSEVAQEVAEKLRDASYLVRNLADDRATKLIADPAFDASLLRERGAQQAFSNNWHILAGRRTALVDIGFRYRDVDGVLRDMTLPFESNTLLPRDINVVIGPNGVGKSQLLRQMVDSWLDDGDTAADEPGFTTPPGASQLVVVSYSPFELFPVDATDAERADRQDLGFYRYFGLRGRAGGTKTNTSQPVRLSRTIPKVNAAGSLIDALSHDQRFGRIREWSAKIETMESVMGSAIDFEFAALELKDDADTEAMTTGRFGRNGTIIEVEDGDLVRRYVRISADRVDRLVPEAIRSGVKLIEGVSFFKDGEPVGLSSGQRLFSYIVINILGAIRQNSLILVDEPELFLHPTLEIRFVGMLKEILAAYTSKALLATHSVVTVRETPADCVHVVSRGKDGIHISNPPFETFGGDVQRITSYVFEDKRVDKPHEAWLRAELKKFGTAQALIEALGDDVNEELIVQITAMEAGKW